MFLSRFFKSLYYSARYFNKDSGAPPAPTSRRYVLMVDY